LDRQVKLSCLLNEIASATDEEKALQDLCGACSVTISQLLRSLEAAKIQGYSQTWQGLGVAINSISTETEIVDMKAMLAGFHESLELNIILGLRYVTSSHYLAFRDGGLIQVHT
jgi:hypothetical protein